MTVSCNRFQIVCVFKIIYNVRKNVKIIQVRIMEKQKKLLAKENLKRLAVDLSFFFVMLMYWELLLFYQLHSSIEGFTVWNFLFIIPIAFLLSSLTGWFYKRQKLNSIVTLLLSFAVSLFYLADMIYYKTFGSLFSAMMMGVGGNAVTGFWWSLSSTLKENILLIVLIELPVLVLLVYIIIRKQENTYRNWYTRLAGLALAVALWFGIILALPLTGTQDHTAYGAYHSRFIDTDTASGKLGILPNFIVETKYIFFGSDDLSQTLQAMEEETVEEQIVEEVETVAYNEYEVLNFSRLQRLSENDTLKTLCEYLDSQTPTEKNEYTGMFEGYNLIYICAESFSSMAIDETVTPTLYKMANSGIVLNNYYNSFKNVTTNGEYAFLTGLWPDVARQNTNNGVLTGTMGQSVDNDMSMALGNMFNLSEGIQSRAYHNYYGYYYGRNRTLPNMGFTCKFMGDGMRFTSSWPASDLEMMEQSVDDYIDDDQFCTYYMTFSGHGNYTTDNIMVYRNYRVVYNMIDEYLPSSAIGYLACNYELEKAMEYLLERLEEAGKLDNTVIVLTGDHYPYYLTDYAYEALTGEKIDNTFGAYKSTCIIYNAGMKEKIETDVPCCNVDILPTVYNLFNIPYDSRLYAGTDIFSNGHHIAQLYNKSFITEYVRYDFSSGKTEWLGQGEYHTEEWKEKYLENMISTVKNRYALSIGIESSDFYSYVFENYDLDQIMKDKETPEVIIDHSHDETMKVEE